MLPLTGRTPPPCKPRVLGLTHPGSPRFFFEVLTFDFFACREDFSSGSKSAADPKRRIPIGYKFVFKEIETQRHRGHREKETRSGRYRSRMSSVSHQAVRSVFFSVASVPLCFSLFLPLVWVAGRARVTYSVYFVVKFLFVIGLLAMLAPGPSW